MGRWSKDTNQYASGSDVSLLDPGTVKTATGNSGWLNSEQFRTAILELAVTAASGTTPTLDVTVDTAKDNAGTNSRSLGAFTQKTGVSNERKSFPGLDNYYRVTWTIGGTTPSFTLGITGVLK